MAAAAPARFSSLRRSTASTFGVSISSRSALSDESVVLSRCTRPGTAPWRCSWLASATAAQLPSGATGDSSIPANASGNSCHSRASTALTWRESHEEGWTNRSRCHAATRSAARTRCGPHAGHAEQERAQICRGQPGLEPFLGTGRHGSPHALLVPAAVAAARFGRRAPATGANVMDL
jgi:hypothetical protein